MGTENARYVLYAVAAASFLGATVLWVIESIHYTVQTDGFVHDTHTGLVWAAADNGDRIDWESAGNYCASLGAGWSLPTVAQLQGLYDISGKLTQSCGKYICQVTPLIQLSDISFWSSESKGSEDGPLSFYLGGGGVVAGTVAFGISFANALCVQDL